MRFLNSHTTAAMTATLPRFSSRANYLWALFVFLVLEGGVSASQPESGCRGVAVAYGALGLDREDVPSTPISGRDLRVCASPHSCCTRSMETRLSSLARVDVDKAMTDSLSHLRQTFVVHTAKFDSFFNELLKNAEFDLNKMFVRTYGLLYQQNSYVFMDLFKDLRNYYRGGNLDLGDVLDSFFATLLQKMFQLLNAQYYMDELYLSCVSNTMDDLKPFGDVPQRLSLQIRRSFVAARTFVQALSVGRDVVHKISQVPLSPECHNALVSMVYCSYCRGLPFLKPCNKLCLDVMGGCLAQHKEINSAWDKYIDHLLLLGDRLESSFNIEQVIEPIDVKISDAIMHFQENGADVTKRVFRACGQPRHHRRRRDVGGESDEPATTTFPSTTSEPHLNENTTDNANTKDDVVYIDDDEANDDALRRQVAITKDSDQPLGKSNKTKKSKEAKTRRKRKKTLGTTEMRYERPEKGRKPLISKPGGLSLDRLVRDIKNKVKIGRGFWSHLPDSLCNNDKLSASADMEDNCWNGEGRGLYEGGRANEIQESRLGREIVDDQLFSLKSIAEKLRLAFKGVEVNWMDNAVADWTGGSGDGSEYDDEEDDEGDDYDVEDDWSGSGSGYDDLGSGGDISFDPENPQRPDISHLPKDKPRVGKSCQAGSCDGSGASASHAAVSFAGFVCATVVPLVTSAFTR